MKNFLKTTLVLLCLVLGFSAMQLFDRTVLAAENGDLWVAEGAASSMEKGDDGTYLFKPGASFRFRDPIDFEKDGISFTFNVEGSFSRKDVNFSLLLQSDYGSYVGENKGLNLTFNPASIDLANSGTISVSPTIYKKGLSEGDAIPVSLESFTTTPIVEREAVTTYNVSMYYVDGYLNINIGMDTVYVEQDLSGIDLKNLKASVVFGGKDASATDIRVRVHRLEKSNCGGWFTGGVNATEESKDSVRLVESHKRQGKALWHEQLNLKKDITIPFKINGTPGYQAGTDKPIDGWVGLFLSDFPNASMPGVVKLGILIRPFIAMENGATHMAVQVFKQGSFYNAFPVGINTKIAGEFNEFRISFKRTYIRLELVGETTVNLDVPQSEDEKIFPNDIAYASMAYSDNVYASTIIRNEHGEEIGREPNPDCKYWDVSLGDVRQVGVPEVEVQSYQNIYSNKKIDIPVRLYSSDIKSLSLKNSDGAYEIIDPSNYEITKENDRANISLNESYVSQMELGLKEFRIISSNEEASYDNKNVDFSFELVNAKVAEEKVIAGRFNTENMDDVKYSFVQNGDVFVNVEGNDISFADYFYNPQTGNLFLKREYLQKLSKGKNVLTVNFKYSSFDIEVDVYSEETVTPPVDDSGQETGCGSALNVSSGILAIGMLTVFGVVAAIKRGSKKPDQ